MQRILIQSFLLLIGALLLSLGWAPYNFILGSFVGLVPLLYVVYQLNQNQKKSIIVFLYAYFYFVAFNFFTIWWVKNASWLGVIATLVVNSFFYALIVVLYSKVSKYLPSKIAYLSFVTFWLAWEYIELLDWDLSWPWMTLGFSLANHIWAIQWYEITGVLGGSLWIVLINLLVWSNLKIKIVNREFLRKRIYLLVTVLVVPILFSGVLWMNYADDGKKINAIVVQPNFDPYTEKFITANGYEQSLSPSQQAMVMMNLVDEIPAKNVDVILFPETAVPTTVKKEEMQFNSVLQTLVQWANSKEIPLITGVHFAEDVEVFDKNNIPADVKKYRYEDAYYKRYNSALWIQNGEITDIYHKSRLVIGVERIPSYFVFLQRYLIDFKDDQLESEYNPNNGIQENRSVFVKADSAYKTTLKLAPIICYESIFGEFVTGYVKNGANLLGIITNDAWWGDTPGYKQHFSYAKLRAIETRRNVVRSANTGWSGAIDSRGKVLFQSEYWKPGAFKVEVTTNEKITTYVKYGDFLGRISIPLSILFIINAFIKRKKNKSLLSKI
ncbi:MAG: apolipoprotein N-acyltransferase [Bacteroidota bacterium]|jgi:apolipoprotein N-acyltransferase